MASPTAQRFRTVVFLYPVLDARWGSGLKRRRARRVMTREERAAVEGVVERLPAAVRDWSDGLAELAPLDVIEVRRPIPSLSSSGGGRWWVGPRECREAMEAHAAPDRYDSIFALWPCDPDVPQCGWGCTIGASDATFGAGFSSISTDHWRTLAMDPTPEQGYVHEWLHQVEGFYRASGVGEEVLPGLHDAGDYTSTRSDAEPPFGHTYAEYHDGVAGDGRTGAHTWAPWYRDWMTGRLRRAGSAGSVAFAGLSGSAGSSGSGAAIGLTPERWALRSR